MKELLKKKKKLLLTIGILFCVQFLSNIPLPGINRSAIAMYLQQNETLIGLFSLFSGNAFQRMSFFVVGISPYITTTIVLQLLRIAIPKLDEMAKDGKTGEEKFKKLTYIVTVVAAIAQALPISLNFQRSGIVLVKGFWGVLLIAVLLTIGSAVQIAAGEFISKKGMGNGISLILLLNILSRFPDDVKIIYSMFIKDKGLVGWVGTLLVCAVVVTLSFVGIIYLQDGEKRIKVFYSKKIRGNGKSFGVGQDLNYLPLKLNMSGVMPIIFTSSMFQIYNIIINLVNVDHNSVFYKIACVFSSNYWFSTSKPWYTVGFFIYCALIFLFSYIYSVLVFDPVAMAERLQRMGGTIPGIRPGEPTVEYIEAKMKSLRVLGSICLIVVTAIPMIVCNLCNASSISFGGTSIVIVVGVILESYKVLQADSYAGKFKNALL